MKKFKVTVYVNTPYSTIVEAKNEKKAIEIALEKDAPACPAYLEDTMEEEWAAEPLWEFPNLGINEIPDVEEV